jgi:hypothetical protein
LQAWVALQEVVQWWLSSQAWPAVQSAAELQPHVPEALRQAVPAPAAAQSTHAAPAPPQAPLEVPG